jgi:hypothetical protein
VSFKRDEGRLFEGDASFSNDIPLGPFEARDFPATIQRIIGASAALLDVVERGNAPCHAPPSLRGEALRYLSQAIARDAVLLEGLYALTRTQRT